MHNLQIYTLWIWATGPENRFSCKVGRLPKDKGVVCATAENAPMLCHHLTAVQGDERRGTPNIPSTMMEREAGVQDTVLHGCYCPPTLLLRPQHCRQAGEEKELPGSKWWGEEQELCHHCCCHPAAKLQVGGREGLEEVVAAPTPSLPMWGG